MPIESAGRKPVEVDVETFTVVMHGRCADLDPAGNATFALQGIGAVCGCLRVGHGRVSQQSLPYNTLTGAGKDQSIRVLHQAERNLD
jgi:hypothetical protein